MNGRVGHRKMNMVVGEWKTRQVILYSLKQSLIRGEASLLQPWGSVLLAIKSLHTAGCCAKYFYRDNLEDLKSSKRKTTKEQTQTFGIWKLHSTRTGLSLIHVHKFNKKKKVNMWTNLLIHKVNHHPFLLKNN